MAKPDLEKAITQLLKDQTAQTNLVEAMWRLYAAYGEVPAGGVQWVESRRCFFMGAACLFDAILRILDEGREPTDADVGRMDRIAAELARFGDELKAGRS